MVHRISVDSLEKSSEARVTEQKFEGIKLRVSNVYTIDHDFSDKELKKIAEALHNPVVQTIRIDRPYEKVFDFALELGYLPGVTDNVANTAAEIIEDLLKIKLGRAKVFSTKVLFITGDVKKPDVECMARELINTLIERYHIKSYNQYQSDKGMDRIVPKVKIDTKPQVLEVDLDIPDKELAELGKKGIKGPDGQRRGPLALSLEYLKAIQEYFKKEGRKPTDIEIESIAQTWSEHCKHTIFSSEMDEIKEGIMKRYIKGATNKIRKELGKNDFCLSVFKDNSGAIIFDDDYMITDKAETHNSPSALDPFGGAITGIVGVNRDTIGFGLGALPIANKYGYCVGRPEDTDIIYRGKGQTNPALFPKRILDGIVDGVNVGGNCSGIPTPLGFVFFDDHYKGKPLVFVGTTGLIPRKLPDGRNAAEKKAQPGDNIVVIGGRVGKDGIHGATFSSEAMDEGSPATAVQIGDPITQKKYSDAIIKEARDSGLYNSNTDNGAGGISCSVAEMAEECGGFVVDLEKVPLKYAGLQPWETWISESQERQTFSVPDKHLKDFMELMESRGVEATVIGTFNDTTRAVVKLDGKKIMDMDMDFLHNGLPDIRLSTEPYAYQKEEPDIEVVDRKKTFEQMLGSHNICSFEWISKQYDHEVQNNSVIKPLVGRGRVNGNASVIRPLLDSKKGVVMSQTLNPRLSELSAYDMAACAIDTAIRNAVAMGADIDHMALMDNFCWCSSDEPERLDQLRDAAKACYDTATAYMTPFISGKDSMFNDFKGYDEKDKPVKISVHPTLMISSLSVIDDVRQTNTFDFKAEGDLIYLIGKTEDELGGSEFYNIHGKLGSKAPKVKPDRSLYKKIHDLTKKGMFSAVQSVSAGGIAMAAAKMAIAGQLGATIDLDKIDSELTIEKKMYSEAQGRFIVTIDPENREAFESSIDAVRIGIVTGRDFTFTDKETEILRLNVKRMEQIYKERFGGY